MALRSHLDDCWNILTATMPELRADQAVRAGAGNSARN
jgi:hypothetical protein